MVDTTVKGVKFVKVTKQQAQALRRHSKHHTKKHMEEMRRLMAAGKTYTRSHELAMKKVGK